MRGESDTESSREGAGQEGREEKGASHVRLLLALGQESGLLGVWEVTVEYGVDPLLPPTVTGAAPVWESGAGERHVATVRRIAWQGMAAGDSGGGGRHLRLATCSDDQSLRVYDVCT